MEENKKHMIDFLKVLIGFASGSILLIMNFMKDITEKPNFTCWVKIFIMLSLLCFTVSVAIGILTIRKIINSYREGMKIGKITSLMLWIFSFGFLFLIFGIAFNIFYNNNFCSLWNYFFNH